jgi:predicted outer membrane repeat protein
MADLRQVLPRIAASILLVAAAPGYCATMTVTNTQDSGAGSLRDAINAINAAPRNGTTNIVFNIPSTDPGCTSADHCTVSVASPLVVMNGTDLLIDGSAQHIVLSWTGSATMGAMLNESDTSQLTLRALTLANANGGAIHTGGFLVIDSSTFLNNSACSGGAIYLEGWAFFYMTNSTFVGNVATGAGACAQPGTGGALFVSRGQNDQTTLYMLHATFADNVASSASGGAVLGAASFDTNVHVDFLNSILARSVGGNCAGGVPGFASLDDDGTCGFDPNSNVVGVDPLLAPLQDNGGPTPTMALTFGSLAIDAANDQLDVHAPFGISSFDQRGTGFPRKVGAHADMGAYEVQTTRIKPPMSLCPPSTCKLLPHAGPVVVPCLLSSSGCLSVEVACCGPVSPESTAAFQPSVMALSSEGEAATSSATR